MEFLQHEIKLFFDLNWNEETNALIVWDAFKAYLRGLLIMLNAKEKKLKEKNLKEVQEKILQKEIELKKKSTKFKKMDGT